MKIQPISNYTVFKGLLGASEFQETQSLYGGEYDCDYYVRAYHPFADETDEEIKNNMHNLQEKINAPELENAKTSTSGSYTSLYQAPRLEMTKAEYARMISRNSEN